LTASHNEIVGSQTLLGSEDSMVSLLITVLMVGVGVVVSGVLLAVVDLLADFDRIA
jgi:hypothetical protein